MPTATVSNPILKRYRTALDEMYGERLERVIVCSAGEGRPAHWYGIAGASPAHLQSQGHRRSRRLSLRGVDG
jgi:hypothetical protein